ncbi:hypothetical protein EJ08DRAFT_700264 [Tothia fuscella]|uniref:Uncharacterized protein n=1 Tax=Tothia fuscella TaxID=1048955 RepID=A0A9P4NLE1_9PEZI|nr:hypothetical protein EJ08DRAFT_700264 [Tothia fuscella]
MAVVLQTSTNTPVSFPSHPSSSSAHELDLPITQGRDIGTLDGVNQSVDDNRALKITLDPSLTMALNKPPEIPPRRSPIPRANCTHTIMDVVHTEAPCDFCGRTSRFGWLYQCQQDADRQNSTKEQLNELKSLVVAPNPDLTIEEELEAIGMSKSVIRQFKQGVYTPDQIARLIEQKLNLHKVIAAQLELEREPWNGRPVTPTVATRADARRESLSMIHKTGNLRRKSPSMSRCSTKACQLCRPYFRERTFMSFGSVFTDDVEMLKSDRGLRVRDGSIVRNLGLRPTPSSCPACRPGTPEASSSSNTSISSSSDASGDSDEDGISARALTRVLSQSTGLLPDTTDGNRETREGVQALSNARPGVDRKTSADSEFDLRTPKTVLRSSGSVDLLAFTRPGGFAGMDPPGRLTRRGSASSSTASDAREIPVEGGVALTEEAVETHVPDIITERDSFPDVMTQV